MAVKDILQREQRQTFQINPAQRIDTKVVFLYFQEGQDSYAIMERQRKNKPTATNNSLRPRVAGDLASWSPLPTSLLENSILLLVDGGFNVGSEERFD